eukprot:scaffold343_cov245-Pinguiococcus_pyrenoidosus.AAC.36
MAAGGASTSLSKSSRAFCFVTFCLRTTGARSPSTAAIAASSFSLRRSGSSRRVAQAVLYDGGREKAIGGRVQERKGKEQKGQETKGQEQKRSRVSRSRARRPGAKIEGREREKGREKKADEHALGFDHLTIAWL